MSISNFHQEFSNLVQLEQWSQLKKESCEHKKKDIISGIFERIQSFEKFDDLPEQNRENLEKSIEKWLGENDCSFNLQDIDNLVKISEIFYFAFSYKIFQNKKIIFQLSLALIKKKPFGVARNLDKLLKAGLDPKDIPELVKALLEQCPDVFRRNPTKFITNCPREQVPEIACMNFEKDPGWYIRNDKEFRDAGPDNFNEILAARLDKKETYVMLAEIFKNDPVFFDYNFDKFVANGLDERQLYKTMKLIIVKQPYVFECDVNKLLSECQRGLFSRKLKDILKSQPYVFDFYAREIVALCPKEQIFGMLNVIFDTRPHAIERQVVTLVTESPSDKIYDVVKALYKIRPDILKPCLDGFLAKCPEEQILGMIKAILENQPNVVKRYPDKCPEGQIPEIMKALMEILPDILEPYLDKFLVRCPEEQIPEVMKAILENRPDILERHLHIFVDKCPEEQIPGMMKAILENRPDILVRHLHIFVDKCPEEQIPEAMKALMENRPDILDRHLYILVDKCPEEQIPGVVKGILENRPYILERHLHIFVDKCSEEKLPGLIKVILKNRPSILERKLNTLVLKCSKEKCPKIAIAIMINKPQLLVSHLWKKSDFIKKFCIEDSDSFIDQFQAQLKLIEIESLMMKGDKDVAFALLISLETLPNFLDYLGLAIEYFPRVTGFLMREQRSKVQKFILDKGLESLHKDCKLSLLPLLPPEEIGSTVSKLDPEIKRKLLEKGLRYDNFSGSTTAVLQKISKANLGEKSQNEIENLEIAMRELLEMVPIPALAAFAESFPEYALSYMPFYNEWEKAVVIPLLLKATWVVFIEKQPTVLHTDYLTIATKDLQEAYIERDFLRIKGLQIWEQEKVKSAKDLKKKWAITSSSTKMAVEQLRNILLRMEKLPSFEKLKLYIATKKIYSETVLEELNEKGKEIERLDSDDELVPDEFIDPITAFEMKDPYSDKDMNTLDKSTWQKIIEKPLIKLRLNPFTRQPLSWGVLTENEKLKQKIYIHNMKKQL